MQHNARVRLLALLVIAAALLLFTWTSENREAIPGFFDTPWENLGLGAFLLFIATVLRFRLNHLQRRRVSATVVSMVFVVSIGLGLLMYLPQSSAQPTLPELTNPTLTPTSGDTSTFFNFTIDYIHSLGLAANVVKVNVSDGANNTYYNFTMIPTDDPEVAYFVQAYWPINGTVVDFANMQDYSAAYAAFQQESSAAPASEQFTNQTDPTACEEVTAEQNWTGCTDAFSSNNVYALANGTETGVVASVEKLTITLSTTQ
ncbi:MAG: hypothetical protein GTO63_13970, partial [Anaerolineae bacterium]|nr:hypothetical protein [Anaerolineae bacterium]